MPSGDEPRPSTAAWKFEAKLDKSVSFMHEKNCAVKKCASAPPGVDTHAETTAMAEGEGEGGREAKVG